MADNQKYSRYLAGGEKIMAVFSIGNRYFWINVIALSPLALILVGLPWLLKIVHLRHSRVYILTDRRVLIKDGIFSTKITSAPYDKITHIAVREDFLKKISYGIGDIKIHTAGAGSTPIEINLTSIDNPMQIKNLIEELMIKERNL